MTPPSDLIAMARVTAARFSLNAALVCAVIEEESSWNTYAIRFEPLFRERYVRDLKLSPTEDMARSTSWGLMQVMGQVAREHGFRARFLSEICGPVVALKLVALCWPRNLPVLLATLPRDCCCGTVATTHSIRTGC